LVDRTWLAQRLQVPDLHSRRQSQPYPQPARQDMVTPPWFRSLPCNVLVRDTRSAHRDHERSAL